MRAFRRPGARQAPAVRGSTPMPSLPPPSAGRLRRAGAFALRCGPGGQLGERGAQLLLAPFAQDGERDSVPGCVPAMRFAEAVAVAHGLAVEGVMTSPRLSRRARRRSRAGRSGR